MKVLTIATQKGGPGKTTLATNLAVAGAQTGKITLLVDADARQKTASEWFRKRENEDNPIVLEAFDQQTLDKILALAEGKGFDLVIIDTQGAETNLSNHAMNKADFCLLPCKSGGFDIGAQRTTAATVLKLNKRAAFVITQAPSRGQEVSETKSILSGLGIQISAYQTTLLKAYKDAALFSSSVLEMAPNSKAADEIRSLYQWVERKLDKNALLEEMEEAVING